MRLILFGLLAFAGGFNAYSQIGWKLDRCRQRFGKERDRDENIYYFGVNYHPYTSDGLHYFSGLQLLLTFDPDGTVGKIEWCKSGSAFSEAEIKHLLQDASRVTWKRKPFSEEDNLDWTGEQNGRVIFDANEEDTFLRMWILTITTR
jgi:hypothetical protein